MEGSAGPWHSGKGGHSAVENKKKSRRVLNAILAVGLAVALWLYVVNVENPTGTTRLRDLDVEIQGSRQLAEQGLMVTSISQDQLDLKVNGRKKTPPIFLQQRPMHRPPTTQSVPKSNPAPSLIARRPGKSCWRAPRWDCYSLRFH